MSRTLRLALNIAVACLITNQDGARDLIRRMILQLEAQTELASADKFAALKKYAVSVLKTNAPRWFNLALEALVALTKNP